MCILLFVLLLLLLTEHRYTSLVYSFVFHCPPMCVHLKIALVYALVRKCVILLLAGQLCKNTHL